MHVHLAEHVHIRTSQSGISVSLVNFRNNLSQFRGKIGNPISLQLSFPCLARGLLPPKMLFPGESVPGDGCIIFHNTSRLAGPGVPAIYEGHRSGAGSGGGASAGPVLRGTSFASAGNEDLRADSPASALLGDTTDPFSGSIIHRPPRYRATRRRPFRVTIAPLHCQLAAVECSEPNDHRGRPRAEPASANNRERAAPASAGQRRASPGIYTIFAGRS